MLFDRAFLAELEALRRRLDPRTTSRGAGERVARRAGSSAEFQEHRAYSAGDDTRRLDWMAFARSGQPVLALFRAEEDSIVQLLVDLSGSLAFGTPTKAETGLRLAAAVGYLSLAAGQRARAVVARHDDSDPQRSPLGVIGRVRRGRGSAAALLRELEAATPGGRTALARSIDHLLALSRLPGSLVVLSDFLDPEPFEPALERARGAGHSLTLVQLVARDELDPRQGLTQQGLAPHGLMQLGLAQHGLMDRAAFGPQTSAGDPGSPGAALLDTELLLEDAETGETLELSLDGAALDAYAASFVAHAERLRRWARRHDACYVRHVTDEPLLGAVRRVVERRID